jgi:hypothetical protein
MREHPRNPCHSLHAGQNPDPTTGARAAPIYQAMSRQSGSALHNQHVGRNVFCDGLTRIESLGSVGFCPLVRQEEFGGRNRVSSEIPCGKATPGSRLVGLLKGWSRKRQRWLDVNEIKTMDCKR